jgi:diguanylate cyclase (GGDEF)-like protein
MTAVRVKMAAVAVVMAAIGGLVLFALPGPDVPSPPIFFTWWALASAFALTETFVIRVHIRRDSHTVSLSEIPFILGLAMSSPFDLVVGRLVGSLVVLVFHRRQAIHKVGFNIGIFVLDTAVALAAYRVLLAGRSQVSAAGLGAGFAALIVALLIGVVAVGIGIRVAQPDVSFRGLASALASAVVIGIVASALGIAGLALAWQDPLALGGVAIAAGGLYGALKVYGALGKRFGDLEAMYDFTSSIDEAVDTERLAELTLSHARQVFGSSFAEIVFSRGVGSTAMTMGDIGVQRRPAPPNLVQEFAAALPDGEAVVAISLSDAPEPVVEHYAREGVEAGMVAVLGGGAGTATLLVVGERSDSLDHEADDLRLLEALARQARASFERGRLVDRLRREISQKEFQSVHDALTGLPNRLHFTFVVEEALRRARADDSRLAVLLVDLDRFKEVNDTLGHQRGDVLLQEMALRLNDLIGGEEHVSRLGGDEFGILLRDLDGVNEAIEWTTKIGDVLHRPFVNEGLAIQVSGSIGIALAPEHGTDGTTLLRRADVAMYLAKSQGSSYEVYDPHKDTYSTRRLAMAAELRSAIETDEIVLAYQPKADIATRTVIGVEALARWPHPRHGMVPPDEFVELAERTGLITPLTDHVLRTALRDIGRLRANGVGISVAVNIAASSLTDDDFPGLVERLLSQFDVPPQSLVLEVTETTMMTDTARSRRVISALSEIGVGLAIDDYGTGYSSLTYLSNLPVGEVKIDRSFVMEMAVDERLAKIVSSTTALVHSLGKKVVAEGVENGATWQLLEEAGCDIAQGYYLARPMPFADLRAWLAAGAPPAGDTGPRGVTPGAVLD